MRYRASANGATGWSVILTFGPVLGPIDDF
jgi:hypothetical protein